MVSLNTGQKRLKIRKGKFRWSKNNLASPSFPPSSFSFSSSLFQVTPLSWGVVMVMSLRFIVCVIFSFSLSLSLSHSLFIVGLIKAIIYRGSYLAYYELRFCSISLFYFLLKCRYLTLNEKKNLHWNFTYQKRKKRKYFFLIEVRNNQNLVWTNFMIDLFTFSCALTVVRKQYLHLTNYLVTDLSMRETKRAERRLKFQLKESLNSFFEWLRSTSISDELLKPKV